MQNSEINSWFPPALESPRNPKVLLNFWKSPGKVLKFFCAQTTKREISKLTPAFFRLPLYVESNSSLTKFCDFHLKYIGCNNVYIYSAHYWMTIFKFAIKSLILELRNCVSNPSATVSVLFDLSPFGTC